jgi:putative membrane protein
MTLDWILASLHHLAIFALAAILAAEMAILTVDIDARGLARLGRIDLGYGVAAAVVVIVGVARVIWGAKGYQYYVENSVFWTKMALFVLVGLLSIPPTVRYVGWGRARRADPGFRPDPAEIARLRRWLWAEAAFFAAIPVAAAAMARGFGMPS